MGGPQGPRRLPTPLLWLAPRSTSLPHGPAPSSQPAPPQRPRGPGQPPTATRARLTPKLSGHFLPISLGLIGPRGRGPGPRDLTAPATGPGSGQQRPHGRPGTPGPNAAPTGSLGVAPEHDALQVEGVLDDAGGGHADAQHVLLRGQVARAGDAVHVRQVAAAGQAQCGATQPPAVPPGASSAWHEQGPSSPPRPGQPGTGHSPGVTGRVGTGQGSLGTVSRGRPRTGSGEGWARGDFSEINLLP